MKISQFILFAVLVVVLGGCDKDYTPKPRSYFRIELPKNEYQVFDEKNYPYTFHFSKYAKIVHIQEDNEMYWLDISYPFINSNIYLSYKKVNKDLHLCIKSALSYINMHQSKSSGIKEVEYYDPENKIYGMSYEIMGKEVASTYQFYLTDSNINFVRGAVYVNSKPNRDSLSPILEFLKNDVDKMMDSFNWK